MVRVDVGATARVAGVLQGMPERPGVGGACRRPNASQLVVSSHENTQLEEGSPLVPPHTSRTGSAFDVDASVRGSGAGRHNRAVGVVGIVVGEGSCVGS